mmetsp:Transcript_65168/g.187575  ORF Transcript_65168/g.187575 Transcript_65168/m.187575 type:complete len:520 (-) Transcript_65168:1170-2729(-)
MPSDLALTFVRVSPVSSCFLAHPLSSNNSPGFSFRVSSLTFLASSFPASRSKPSVRIVSFSTRKYAPCVRNSLPWLPATVTQPSTPSSITFARIRITSVCSSLIGPSSTWTTSPISSRLTVVAPLMARPVVIATSLTTFISTIITSAKAALETTPARSSSSPAKARCRSSSESAGASPSPELGSPRTKAASRSGPKPSAPSEAIASKSASAVRLLEVWCAFNAKTTFEAKSFTSEASFFAASVLAFSKAAAARWDCDSTPALAVRSFCFSTSNHACSTSSTSVPAPNDWAALTTSEAFSVIALNPVSASSAFASISAEVKALPSTTRALDCLLASAISASTALILAASSSILACASAFCAASARSRSSRNLRRSRSRTCSRAMPTATARRWKSASRTPAPPPAMAWNIFSRAGSGIANWNSPWAYCMISVLLSMPSASLSYLLNTDRYLCMSRAAAARFRMRSSEARKPLASVSRRCLLAVIRNCTFCNSCSEGSSPASWLDAPGGLGAATGKARRSAV